MPRASRRASSDAGEKSIPTAIRRGRSDSGPRAPAAPRNATGGAPAAATSFAGPRAPPWRRCDLTMIQKMGLSIAISPASIIQAPFGGARRQLREFRAEMYEPRMSAR
jgi:hypothetical protein